MTMADTPQRVMRRGLRKNNTAQGEFETPGGGRRRRPQPALRTCVSFPALAEAEAARSEESDYVATPTPAVRLRGSLLDSLTPTRGSPGEASPTPMAAATPFQPRSTQRRLTFTPAPALFTPPATKLVRPDPRAFTSTGLQSKRQQVRARASLPAGAETPCRVATPTQGLGATSTQGLASAETPCRAATPAQGVGSAQGIGSAQGAGAAQGIGSAETPFRQPERLGKHRASTESLRRTRKRIHVGAEDATRGRQNTLVDERARLGGLPPSFAPQHAQLLQSMEDARWSWGSDGASESSATLAPGSPRARKPLFEMDVDSGSASDDDDVFGRARSPRIDAVERPQMPQIVQGCATNYPHFVGRAYFARGGGAFLAPGGEFHVDGLGYLDYYAHMFEVLGRAGEGSFSTVDSVRSLDDGQLYAVKRTREPYGGRAERARRLREVEILWALPPSAGVVRLVNAWEQFGHLYMQFELCERGSLAGYLDACAARGEYVPEALAWAVLAQAARAVAHVHAQGVVHLDVKPANLLLGAGFAQGEARAGWVKLADFGHAVRLPREPQAWAEEGDRQYMAPEVLRGEYAAAADVFSLGLTMLEVVADVVLPENGPDWHKLREGCFDDPVFDDLPYSAELLELVKLMLHPQPARRPTLAQVAEQCRRCAGAATPLPSDDEGEDFVRIRRQHSFAGFARPARPALLRAATAGSADELQSSSAHPMVTRSAAKAGSDGGGLARRTASAPGTAAIF